MLETFLNSVESVSIILILTAIGFLLGKMQIMDANFKSKLSRLLIIFAIPLSCIYAIKQNLSKEVAMQSLSWSVMIIVAIGINFLFAFFVGKLLKIPQYRLGVFMMASALSNSLFIGYAMCTELFGNICSPYVMIYYAVSTAYTQLVGVTLVQWSGTGESFTIKKIPQFLKTPPVIGIVVAIILVYLNIPVPKIAMSVMKYFNNIVSPLALFMTGFIIYEIGFSKLKIDRDMFFMLLIRFVFSPLMMILFCKFMGITGLPRNVFVVMSAMPVVSQTPVCATAYGADEAFAARCASISTIASFIVIPILMLIIS